MSLLDDLAARIDALHPGRRVRVAVDGVDCAGKTTWADALAARLQREAVRTSVDDYPHPPEVRYRLGRESAEGCYRDTTDLALLRRRALDPFGPGGDGAVRLRGWDDTGEAPVDLAPRRCGPSAALLVDGVFLQRPGLRSVWDLVVLLVVPDEEVLRRAVLRDTGRLPDVERLYRTRYLPAQRLYAAEARPAVHADVVVDNTDPAAPVVLRGWAPEGRAGAG